MARLAAEYASIEEAMPISPPASAPPTLAEALSGRVSAATPTIFGAVYPNGLATASAALGGRFGTELAHLMSPPAPAPVEPGPAAPRPLVGGGGDPASPSASPATNPAANPTGSPTLSVKPTTVGMPGMVAATGAGAATAGYGMGGFYPPMMPPHGGGMAADGARSVPAWLVGSEEIFGVDVETVWPVIGEAYEQPSNGGWT